MSLGFNKVCGLEDFDDPELRAVIEEIFPEAGPYASEGRSVRADSKRWEIAMSCRSLRVFDALRQDAVVLGVGAGTERTSFHLTRYVRQVIATDLYLAAGQWADVAPSLMLVEPERFAPGPFERERLSVQHIDGRWLRFPDETFDGIYSSGSIEHFGGLDFVANAAFEMGRVLKPGGVLTLSTEFKIAGPPGGDGWDAGTLVLSEERIRRYVIEASGLECVDPLVTELSQRTLESQRDLATFLQDASASSTSGEQAASYPNIVLVHEGYAFCSIHLTMRKTDAYPFADNEWARPSPATTRAVASGVEDAERMLLAQRPRDLEAVAQPAPSASDDVAPLIAAWDAIPSAPYNSRVTRRLPTSLARVYRACLRVRYLGHAWEAESALFRAIAARLDGLGTEVRDLRREGAEVGAEVRDLRREGAEVGAEVRDLRREVESLRTELGKGRSQIEERERLLQEALSSVRLRDYELALGPDDLTGKQIVQLMRTLEDRVAELGSSSAIDVSVVSASAEPAIVAAAEYLGDRLSAKPAVYRMPNDAWYHVDIAGKATDASLFEDAEGKLVPGGLLVLVTADDAPHGAEPPPSFVRVADAVVDAGGRLLHARVLATPAAAG